MLTKLSFLAVAAFFTLSAMTPVDLDTRTEYSVQKKKKKKKKHKQQDLIQQVMYTSSK